ncbi:MAG: DnaA/Hda family protein [Parvularcula sp.]
MRNLALEPVYATEESASDSSEVIGDRPHQTLLAQQQTGLGQMQTLDRFCVNESNRVARHAVTRVLDGTAAPITYIYGSTGRGKSHLINAVALEWLRRNPGGRLFYLHYDTLVADVSEAHLTNSFKELKEHLQDTDILILDDVHLLRGRKRTQEELRCLIGRLVQAGKTVLIAGSLPPPQLAEMGLYSRLAEILVGGMVAEIKAPDYELRLRIANQQAEEFFRSTGISVPQRQIDLVARRCDASVRELVGAMNRLGVEMEAMRGEISDDQVAEFLHALTATRSPAPTPEAIFDYVTEVFGVTHAELRGPSRRRPFVLARHGFCKATRELTGIPLEAIGDMINRDHTTVLNSLRKAEEFAESNTEFADRLGLIMERFTPS